MYPQVTQPSGGTVNSDGPMDMQQLLAAAQEMQNQLLNAQQELADTEVEGSSGGGLVTARVNGQGELVDLTISATAIDADDPAGTAQAVADLVLAAVRDAYRGVADLQQEKMGPLAAGLGGGLGQPGMPGAPGQLPDPASLQGLFGDEPRGPGEPGLPGGRQ
jgi:nucleoid-associated protein EbfC